MFERITGFKCNPVFLEQMQHKWSATIPTSNFNRLIVSPFGRLHLWNIQPNRLSHHWFVTGFYSRKRKIGNFTKKWWTCQTWTWISNYRNSHSHAFIFSNFNCILRHVTLPIYSWNGLITCITHRLMWIARSCCSAYIILTVYNCIFLDKKRTSTSCFILYFHII